MIEVIPAILEKDFSEIEKKVHFVEKFVDWVQIDIADGVLVNNTTYIDTKGYSTLGDFPRLELHMMVSEPMKYLAGFIECGFKRFIPHIEADGIEDFIVKCQESDAEVGLAIDGKTSIEKVYPYLDDIDVVLIMAIDAGESGRPFREDTIEKIRKLKEKDFDMPIAVDGAMNLENARKVVMAGATRINSNSYIFKSSDISKAIDSLKNL